MPKRKLKYLLFALGILLSLFVLTSSSIASLTAHLEQTIYDDSTDLIWIDHTFSPLTWNLATSFAADLDFANSTAWRLPTKTELLTLVNDYNDPKISHLFNLGPVSRWSVWSSTTITDSHFILSDRAYLITFLDGSSFTAPKLSRYSFLLVRDNGDYDYQLFTSDTEAWVSSSGDFLLGAP